MGQSLRRTRPLEQENKVLRRAAEHFSRADLELGAASK